MQLKLIEDLLTVSVTSSPFYPPGRDRRLTLWRGWSERSHRHECQALLRARILYWKQGDLLKSTHSEWWEPQPSDPLDSQNTDAILLGPGLNTEWLWSEDCEQPNSTDPTTLMLQHCLMKGWQIALVSTSSHCPGTHIFLQLFCAPFLRSELANKNVIFGTWLYEKCICCLYKIQISLNVPYLIWQSYPLLNKNGHPRITKHLRSTSTWKMVTKTY